jgi:outer membrane protein OmpA-like peptidoglycan-associated protein
MGHRMRLGLLAAALSVVAAGCATVEWTEDLFAKRQVEVDARFTQVETGVREQGDRIDRVEVRVANLDTRLTETRDLVRTALPHAPLPPTPSAAATRPTPTEARPSPPALERGVRGRTLVGVVHVPFGFDRADLEPGAEAALAAIVKELREHPTMTIDLEGTTDGVGRLDYNLRLSQRRVEAVTRWLMARGVDRSRIVGAKGRGPVANTSVKDDVKRRVMVKLMTSAE